MANRLANEASPYLRHHQDDLVDWHVWGPDPFAQAARQDKPLLVSIGYSACYWCHVMARESFADADIAAVLNRDFVCIKVDREERPDIDRQVLDAMARLRARTGWPVTAFMTPQGRVFAGGSYYPPRPMQGLPAFAEVLADAARRFHAGDTGAADATAQPAQAVTGQASVAADLALFAEHVARRLVDNLDPVYGGFGVSGPKFPQPALHELLWRIHTETGEAAFRDAALASVRLICRSALFDHAGGGFHRYCVDDAWTEPHYEKMLYDNAQMVELLTWLWRGTGETLFADRIEQTIAWALSELRLPDGAFGASLGAYADHAADGDSGGYYQWRADQLDAALGDHSRAFRRLHDLNPSGTLARSERADPPGAAELIARGRDLLLAARAKRPAPARDGKTLADWNGLMIAALLEAGIAFARTDWTDAARSVFDTLAATLERDGRLAHCVTDGRVGPAGLLEDYAQMSRAALRLFEAFGNTEHLAAAERWVAVLDRHFWHPSRGGYCASADDHWHQSERLRTITETSVPNGNGAMIGVLGRLHELTGRAEYLERAEALAASFRQDIVRYGISAATALNAVLSLHSPLRIVVTGLGDDAQSDALLRAARACDRPDRIVLRQMQGAPSAQICIGTLCLPPVAATDALGRLLAPGGLRTHGPVSVTA